MIRMNRKKAFTLIELITVMAITAILLTIIFVPVIQGFQFTRAAQAFTDGQNRARTLIARLEREVGNATDVRDNNGDGGALNVVVPGQNGAPELVRLEGVKLDFYKPAEGDPAAFVTGPGGNRAYIDPDTGKADPTLRAPKGDPNFPAAGGQTLVRYFVGLRDPFATYNNPYDGLLMQRAGGRDNLFVLLRAEVPVYEWDAATTRYVVDADLFFDQDNDTDPTTRGPLLDDLNFFVPDGTLPGTYGGPVPGWDSPGVPNKDQMVRNWLSRAQVVTEVSRFDMIMPVYDRARRTVAYNGNVPQLVPLVRFQPTRISNEPAAGQLAVRTGEETFNADKVGPDVFRTDYGAWSNLFLRILPSLEPAAYGRGPGQRLAGDVKNGWASSALGANQPYLIGRPRVGDNTSMYWIDPTVTNEAGGVEVFDVTQYLRDANSGVPYAFSRAVAAANGRSGWLGNAAIVRDFIPVAPDPRGGRVTASFDVREMGDITAGVPTPFNSNMPFGPTGAALTPDTEVFGGTWDATGGQINTRFNVLWNQWNTLGLPGLPREDYAKRFLDLRLATMPDGTVGPLHPTLGFGRAAIVPGSEIVIGPDQRPGTTYGRPVRYTRVTQRPVGPNQYIINYVHQREPDWVALGVITPAEAATFYNPSNYVATDVRQVLLQAAYRAGYLELNSNKNEPLPAGNISVSYRFQFTEPNDIVAVDYDSSEVMEFVLTIRNYPQSNNPEPQSITLKGTSDVRNFIR